MDFELPAKIISRVPKRTFSDLDNQPISMSVPLKHPISPEKPPSGLKIPIKINKNKLPPDFFLRTEERRRRIPNKILLRQQREYLPRSLPQRAQSERMHISPERTSYFGFFNEEQERSKKDTVNMRLLKRNFETSQSPKRQVAQQPHRNLTPFTLSQNSDFIDLVPVTKAVDYPEEQSPYLKNKKISPRKQHMSKYRDLQQAGSNCLDAQMEIASHPQPLSPNKTRVNRENMLDLTQMNSKLLERSDKTEKNTDNLILWPHSSDSLNMTFSNVKSTCFPPISSKNAGRNQ